MAKVYGVLNQKGGAGKTTLALNLAVGFALGGKQVLVIDADAATQQSASDWSFARKTAKHESLFPVLGMKHPTIHDEIGKMGRGYDIVIIDGVPRNDAMAISIIKASDLVIIPVQPSALDAWATAETVDMIRQMRNYAAKPACFVVNRKITGTVLASEIRTTLGGFEIDLLEATLGNRVLFAGAMGSGQGVMEVEPKGEAAAEVAALIGELEEKYHGN